MPKGVYERKEIVGTKAWRLREAIMSLQPGDAVTAKVLVELVGNGVQRQDVSKVLHVLERDGVVRRSGRSRPQHWERVGGSSGKACDELDTQVEASASASVEGTIAAIVQPQPVSILQGPVGDLLWVLTEYLPDLERRVAEAEERVAKAEADAAQCRDQMQKMASVFQAATTVRDRARRAGVMAVSGD